MKNKLVCAGIIFAVVLLCLSNFASSKNVGLLKVDGNLNFGEGIPGREIYSGKVIVKNIADKTSLNMYISGTDFYDSSSSGAACPDTNQLLLGNVAYYAESGRYNTKNDPRADEKGFVNVEYELGYNNPDYFEGTHEIIQIPGFALDSNEELTLLFRLDIPSACIGHFDTGNVFISGVTNEGREVSFDYPLSFNFEAEN